MKPNSSNCWVIVHPSTSLWAEHKPKLWRTCHTRVTRHPHFYKVNRYYNSNIGTDSSSCTWHIWPGWSNFCGIYDYTRADVNFLYSVFTFKFIQMSVSRRSWNMWQIHWLTCTWRAWRKLTRWWYTWPRTWLDRKTSLQHHIFQVCLKINCTSFDTCNPHRNIDKLNLACFDTFGSPISNDHKSFKDASKLGCVCTLYCVIPFNPNSRFSLLSSLWGENEGRYWSGNSLHDYPVIHRPG